MKLRNLLLATIGLFGLISCEKSENVGTSLPEDNVIRVTAGVNDPATRAGAETATLTEFGMFVKAATYTYSYDNIKTTKDITWTTSDMMLWKNATDAVDIIAYAPYDVAFTDLATARTIGVKPNQSAEADILASDFMYSKSSVTPSNPVTANSIYYDANTQGVKVTLNHHLSKLFLTITLGMDFFSVGQTINPITDLTINGTKIEGTLSLETGAITLTRNATAITPFTGIYTPILSAQTGSAKYEAIIMPQSVAANNLSIAFILDGKRYAWTSTNEVIFANGKSLTLALTVGKESVTVSPLYKIGDVYPKGATGSAIIGVVFSINGADGHPDFTQGATGATGTIVALVDEEGYFQWSTSDFDIYMRNTLTDDAELYFGRHANDFIRDYIATNGAGHTQSAFPAYNACAIKTTGGVAGDWYLPSRAQLHKRSGDGGGEAYLDGTSESGLYHELTTDNGNSGRLRPVLGVIGSGANSGGSLGDGVDYKSFTVLYYWSSTETSFSSYYSWFVNFGNGYVTNYYYTKSYDNYVRCVRDF